MSESVYTRHLCNVGGVVISQTTRSVVLTYCHLLRFCRRLPRRR